MLDPSELAALAADFSETFCHEDIDLCARTSSVSSYGTHVEGAPSFKRKVKGALYKQRHVEIDYAGRKAMRGTWMLAIPVGTTTSDVALFCRTGTTKYYTIVDTNVGESDQPLIMLGAETVE